MNLDNKELLAICDQLNISVKNHSSTIPEAERIRAAAEKQAASLPPHERNQVPQTRRITHKCLQVRPKPSLPTNSKFWRFVVKL